MGDAVVDPVVGPVVSPAVGPLDPVVDPVDVATPPRLRAGQTAVALVLPLLLMVVLLAAGGLLAVALGRPDLFLPLAFIGASAGVWGGIWLTLVRQHGWGLREMGFVSGPRSAWHLCWQVPVSIGAGGAAAAALGTALGLTAGSGPTVERDLVAADLAWWWVVVVVAIIVLVVPAAEEVLFRRVLLDALLDRLPRFVALPLAAVAFALVHLSPVVMVYVVFLGLALGALRVWHQNLWAPLVLHMCNNALVTTVALGAVYS